MNICITGATGFIGRKLAEQHLKLGHEVRYLTRVNKKPVIGAHAFIGDVNSKSKELLLFLHHVDVFYHCAGELKNEVFMHSTHVQGTINLLNLIEKSRSQNQDSFHWIQLSSCGAYGQTTSHPSIERYVNENTDENPSGEYERTKTEADQLVIAFAKKHDWFKYTIIRPTIVFGVGMSSTAIVRMALMIKKRFFFYVGNKNSIANYVHVDDIVKAMMLIVNQPKTYNQTFIVSNDCKFSDAVDTIANTLHASKLRFVVSEFLLRKFVDLVGRVIKLPIGSVQIDVMMRQTHYSNQKITRELNWSPDNNILDQLQEYIHIVFNAKNG